jgi:outer membrane protein
MKQTAIIALLMICIVASGKTVLAQHPIQVKLACISLNQLLSLMPETKKADTTLDQYRAALQQEFDSYQSDSKQQLADLSSRDTLKFNPEQLELKRRNLGELLAKLQGYNQQASQLLEQKRSALFTPIQKKAETAIQEVSKELGYSYVIEKDDLQVYPPSEDILPLVKKRLGLH